MRTPLVEIHILTNAFFWLFISQKNNWFFLFLFTRGKKGKKQEKKLQFL
jgi:hypothetical protein